MRMNFGSRALAFFTLFLGVMGFFPVFAGTFPVSDPDTYFPDIPDDPKGYFVERPVLIKGNLVQTNPTTSAVAMRNALLQAAGIELPDGVELQLAYQYTVPSQFGRPSVQYVRYQQIVAGLPVEGSAVHLTIKKAHVLHTRIVLFPELSLPEPKFLSAASLQKKARASLQVSANTPIRSIKNSIQWVKGNWRYVSKITVEQMPLVAVVDRLTGEVFRHDQRRHSITGTIQGQVVPFDPFVNPLVTLPLSDLGIVANGVLAGSTLADGTYSISPATPASILLSLANGSFVQIIDATPASTESFAFANVPDASVIDQTFNLSGTPGHTGQTNGFYHVNLVRNYVVSQGFTPAGINDSLITVVNSGTDICNAFYDPADPSINFMRAGSIFGDICPNTAYDTVIYHEWGHYLDDLFGGDHAGSLGEGCADVLAFLVSDQPLMGENFFLPGSINPETFIRTANNTFQYPPGGSGEIHDVGQALSGFAWDLREFLRADLGQIPGTDLAAFLYLTGIFAADPTNIPGAVTEVVIADDDDADLSNGTPNFARIEEAALAHGLGCLAVFGCSTPTPTPAKKTSTSEGQFFTSGNSSESGGGCSQGTGGFDFAWLGLLLPWAAAWIGKKPHQ